jgi:hypothetical protein|nr:MAG TPA: putative protease [Caudoviricetes sp.]
MSEENSETPGVEAGGDAGESAAPSDESGTLLTGAQSQEQDQTGQTEKDEPPESGEAEGEPEGAKKDEKEEQPKGAPEKYDDFSMPEGTELDAEVGETFRGVAKELDLTQEQAQGVLDKLAPVMQRRTVERIKAISDEWAQKSKTDKEIGGQHLTQTLSDVARLRDQFAHNADGQVDADIQEFMSSPMGNHPGCLKLLARIGKAFGEARYPTGEPARRVFTPEDVYR